MGQYFSSWVSHMASVTLAPHKVAVPSGKDLRGGPLPCCVPLPRVRARAAGLPGHGRTQLGRSVLRALDSVLSHKWNKTSPPVVIVEASGRDSGLFTFYPVDVFHER